MRCPMSKKPAMPPSLGRTALLWLCTASAANLAPTATAAEVRSSAVAVTEAIDPATDHSSPAKPLPVTLVSAEKRQSDAQRVAISLAALDAIELGEARVLGGQDILQRLPNADIAAAGGGKNNYFIRGVGTSDFHLNAVGAIGLYIDEVPQNSPFAQSFGLLDPQRVEVLRGPQNTLFGRNTAGGAVHFISATPELNAPASGFLRLASGRFNDYTVETAYGLTVSTETALRIALSSEQHAGLFHNQTLDQAADRSQRELARMQWRAMPREHLDLLLRLHAGRERGSPTPYRASGLLDPNNRQQACGVALGRRLPYQRPDCVDAGGFNHSGGRWRDVFGNLPHRQDIDSEGANLRLRWQGEQLILTAISAFEQFEVRYAEDADASPNTLFHFYQHAQHQQWSHEFRLSSPDSARTRWLLGLFAYREDADYVSAVRRSPSPVAAIGPDHFQTVPNTIVDQRERSRAAFAQLDHELTEALTLSAGLRISDESKRGWNRVSVRCVGPISAPLDCPSLDSGHFMAQRDLLLGLPGLVELPAERLDAEWRLHGGRLGLRYQLDPQRMLYGTLSRGFKGGGFSVAALQGLLGLSAADVDPERLDALELGLKSEWPEHRLRLNAALFHYRWRGLQAFQPLLDPATGIATPQLLNVPKSRLQGAELELDWLPADDWTVQLGLGYLRSRIDDPGLIAGVTAGNPLPYAPRWSANLKLRKEWPIGEGWFGLQALARYRDEQSNDLAYARDLRLPGYQQWDLAADYRFGREQRYLLSLWVDNLGGEPRCAALTSLAGLAESTTCVAVSDATAVGIGLRVELP